MAQITIRNLDDAVMQALRKRATAAGRSVEDEARRTLANATGVDREVARARLEAVHNLLKRHTDTPAEDLLKQIRNSRLGSGSVHTHRQHADLVCCDC
jgi:plasmid stability protein